MLILLKGNIITNESLLWCDYGQLNVLGPLCLKIKSFVLILMCGFHDTSLLFYLHYIFDCFLSACGCSMPKWNHFPVSSKGFCEKVSINHLIAHGWIPEWYWKILMKIYFSLMRWSNMLNKKNYENIITVSVIFIIRIIEDT